MGVYTNFSRNNYYTSSDYRDVEPYHGEHFNFHELGIIAAAESAANQNAFMKAIALNELASVEQYGTEEVFYESVDISGIFDKIKAFFKKIIDKIHKIFHTFIAKMSSWFGSNKDFAKKYEKEIIKNWGLVKSDWEFKGYKFTNLPGKNANFSDTYDASKNILKAVEVTAADGNTKTKVIEDLINAKKGESLKAALKAIGTSDDIVTLGSEDENTGDETADARAKAKNDAARNTAKQALNSFRDKMDEWKELVRGAIMDSGSPMTTINMSNKTRKLDSKEFTEELFKVFRNGQDTKDDIKLSELGSAHEVITFIKDYDKIKEQTEKLEKAMVKSIDELINAISKAQDDLIKEKKDSSATDKDKLDNDYIIQATATYQSCWGFVKECQTQAFSAMLQALKDCCAQNKEVCVKVISANKKMTEESYDYSNSYNGGNFNSFIESVKLV